MKAIVELSIKHRVVGNVAFVLVACLGVLTLLKLPVDAWPDISLDEAWITTIWDGAGTEEIELLVTKKIEDEIVDVRGVKRIISHSSPNVSSVDVKFDEDLAPHEFEAAFNDLRTALDRVIGLPPDAKRPVLRKLTTSEVYPIFQIAVAAGDDTATEVVLREVADDLKRELEKLPGISRIRLSGDRDRELQVQVDRLAARRHGIDLPGIARALTRTGVTTPAGSIATARESGSTVEVELDEVRIAQDAEFDIEWDVLDAVVRTFPEGAPLRVRDVAQIAYGFEKRRLISRYNGLPAVVLNVAKDNRSNSIRLRAECEEIVERVGRRAPSGVRFGFTADTTKVVRSRFRVLLENLLQGLVLVSFLLWGLLGIRNALIALVGIPFSFLCALLVFPFLDIGINNLTLFGLVLVGGMVVDDAVVVLENIYRRVESGEAIRTAIVEGVTEVAWPVTNAVATTMAAMLPLLIQGGVTGKFFAFIPKAVMLALLCSLIQCFTILPIHYLEWGTRLASRGDRKGPARRAGARGRLFAWLTAHYARILRKLLHHRFVVLALSGGLTLFLVGMVLEIPEDPWTSDFNAVFITVDCDSSYALSRTDTAVRIFEDVVEELVDEDIIESYSTTVGFKMTPDGVFISRPNVAFILAELVDKPEITSNPEIPLNLLRERLERARAASRRLRFESVDAFAPHDGPPLGRPVAIRVESDDYLLASEAAELIKRELGAIRGVFSIADNLYPGPTEYRFRVDEERASRFGLMASDVGVALRAANDGLVAGTYREGDDDVAIRVLYAPRDRRKPEDLRETDIRTSGGALVRLGDVTRVEIVRPWALAYHHDGKRTVLVTAEVDSSIVTGPEVNARMEEKLADVPARFPGVRLHFGGEFEETRKSMAQQRQSFWIALVLIYLILAAQFRRYFQPLVVMMTVPFGVLGVLFGLLVRGQPFTIPTFIAIIGLAGIVVNESLVMVVFINRMCQTKTTLAAIVAGASRRLRPILITSLTTIANLTPLAFGIGGTSKVWTPFAVSIVFGLSFSTVVTLFLTPIFYSFTVEKQFRSARKTTSSST